MVPRRGPLRIQNGGLIPVLSKGALDTTKGDVQKGKAGLQPLSPQSQRPKGRARVSPSQIPESTPPPLRFFSLLPFSGIHPCFPPGPPVPRELPLTNARGGTASQRRGDVGMVCFLLVLRHPSFLAFPGRFTRTAKR